MLIKNMFVFFLALLFILGLHFPRGRSISATFINSITVVVSDVVPDQYVSGGGLPSGTWKFHSYHFHWGATSTTGSEHKINGKQ